MKNCRLPKQLTVTLLHFTHYSRVPGVAALLSGQTHQLAEPVPEPNEIGNVIEEVVDLARQINLEVDSDGVQELLDFYNQELTMDELIEMHEQEQDIEKLESLDPV
ncbi:uncharacterized protein TNCV_4101681 [Trichonephila clavipes]|nr:uncharacterized protein TNCV_4101681 [Trichonephila clavipes]